MRYLTKPSIILSLTLLVVATTVMTVSAETVVRTSDEAISLAEDQIIEGDFYLLGENTYVSGTVAEDLVAVTFADATLNGTVGGDAFLTGATVNVHGTVADDLRVVGGVVKVGTPINGDLFVIGGDVDLLSTASVTGDVVVFGGDVTISGSVGGNVQGRMEQLRIDAPVAGAVEVSVGAMALGDRAAIGGDVQYVSFQTVTRSTNAVVEGELVRNDPATPLQQSDVRWTLLPALVLLFSALVWYWLSPRSLEAVVDRALTVSVRPLLIGLSALILSPVVMGVLVLSWIGSLLSLVLLFWYLLFLILALCAVPAVLGRLMVSSYKRESRKLTLLSLLAGVIAIMVLLLLPLVGAIVLAVVFVVTLGSLVDGLLALRKGDVKRPAA